ncbi:MAG: hypothetical protein COB61_009245, partial [Thiotrichales bacterium]|nr:hypothetical protein [Thiotrichales bacterium]
MRRFIAPATVLAIAICIGVLVSATAQSKSAATDSTVDDFISLLAVNGSLNNKALKKIEADWQSGFTIMAVEVMALLRDREGVARLVDLLEENTGQKFGFDIQGWRTWLWN